MYLPILRVYLKIKKKISRRTYQMMLMRCFYVFFSFFYFVKYVPTYTDGILKKNTAKDSSNDVYAMFLCCFFLFSSLKYMLWILI